VYAIYQHLFAVYAPFADYLSAGVDIPGKRMTKELLE